MEDGGGGAAVAIAIAAVVVLVVVISHLVGHPIELGGPSGYYNPMNQP